MSRDLTNRAVLQQSSRHGPLDSGCSEVTTLWIVYTTLFAWELWNSWPCELLYYYWFNEVDGNQMETFHHILCTTDPMWGQWDRNCTDDPQRGQWDRTTRCVLILRTLHHDSQALLLQLPLLLCRPHVEIRVLRRGTSLAQTHENAPVVWSMPLDYHVYQRNIENGFGENSSFNITTTLSLSLYVPYCGDSLHKI